MQTRSDAGHMVGRTPTGCCKAAHWPYGHVPYLFASPQVCDHDLPSGARGMNYDRRPEAVLARVDLLRLLLGPETIQQWNK